MPGKDKKRSNSGEDDLIELMKSIIGSKPRSLITGIGDDCAVIENDNSGSDTLVTTDLLVEGSHFKLDWASPYQIGWKAMAASVSDIAAMGGRPTFAFISLGIRTHGRDYFVKSFYEGIQAAAEKYNITVAGGDTVRSDLVVANVTLMGKTARGAAITRKGASAGDIISVTSTCGDSLAGLEILKYLTKTGTRPSTYQKQLIERHSAPTPSVKAGLAASASGCVKAMMDLSDGILIDLPRLCKINGTGAKINTSNLPVSPELERWAAEAKQPAYEYAIKGGEDFNLLVISDAAKHDQVSNLMQEIGVELSIIGEITGENNSCVLVSDKGKETPFSDSGFKHF